MAESGPNNLVQPVNNSDFSILPFLFKSNESKIFFDSLQHQQAFGLGLPHQQAQQASQL